MIGMDHMNFKSSTFEPMSFEFDFDKIFNVRPVGGMPALESSGTYEHMMHKLY